MTALFLDVSGDLTMKVPTLPEKRERMLQELFHKQPKPVVLFMDEAHDLHGNTLIGLRRLMEIGNRTTKFTFDGLADESRPFLDWQVGTAVAKGVKVTDVSEADALDILAERLSTSLQFAEHLTRAFTEALNLGTNPVAREMVKYNRQSSSMPDCWKLTRS